MESLAGGRRTGPSVDRIVIFLVMAVIAVLVLLLFGLAAYMLFSSGEDKPPLVSTNACTTMEETTKASSTRRVTTQASSVDTGASTIRTTTLHIITTTTTRATTTRAPTTTTLSDEGWECASDGDCPRSDTYYECRQGDVYRVTEEYSCVNHECVFDSSRDLYEECGQMQYCEEGERHCIIDPEESSISSSSSSSSSKPSSTTSTSSTTTTSTPTTTLTPEECLNQNGVFLYTKSVDCSLCDEIAGEINLGDINYVDCYDNPWECPPEEITEYPTWILLNGSTYPGYSLAEMLAELGCS